MLGEIMAVKKKNRENIPNYCFISLVGWTSKSDPSSLQQLLPGPSPSVTWATDSPKNVCRICAKSFSKKATLNRHFLIHTGEKPFVCKKCGKSFNQNSSLKRHVVMHENHQQEN